MRKMKWLTRALPAAAVLGLGFAQSGWAATLSYTETVTQVGTSGTGFTLSVDRFDASLGTLNSALVTVSGVSTTTNSQTSSPTFIFGSYVDTDSADAMAFAALNIRIWDETFFQRWASDSDFASCTSPTNAAESCTVTATATAEINAESQTFTNANLLSLFFVGNPGDQLDFVFRNRGEPGEVISGGSVAIEYTYAPAAVPLPASSLLLIGGLALAGAVARKRKS